MSNTVFWILGTVLLLAWLYQKARQSAARKMGAGMGKADTIARWAVYRALREKYRGEYGDFENLATALTLILFAEPVNDFHLDYVRKHGLRINSSLAAIGLLDFDICQVTTQVMRVRDMAGLTDTRTHQVIALLREYGIIKAELPYPGDMEYLAPVKGFWDSLDLRYGPQDD